MPCWLSFCVSSRLFTLVPSGKNVRPGLGRRHSDRIGMPQVFAALDALARNVAELFALLDQCAPLPDKLGRFLLRHTDAFLRLHSSTLEGAAQ